MSTQTPYSKDLGDREPIGAMRDSAGRYQRLLSWTPAQFERSYAPGKWSARQILIHLAQTELALGTRARMALTTPSYAAQAFNQDHWMTHETALTGKDAVDALVAMSVMNRVFFESLSDASRATPFAHPEY